VILGVRIAYFIINFALRRECHPVQQGHARGRVQRTVYKVLVRVEKDPFFNLDVPIRWLEPET
jgi:hypothetical protein